MRRVGAGLIGLAVVLCGAGPAGTVAVDGPKGTGKSEDAAALDGLSPRLSKDLRLKDGRTVAFSGPALFAVLQQAGVVPTDMRVRAHETVTVTGSDGYAAVLALAELDPGFEGKAVELATRADGKALVLPRLIVPGDRVLSRDVRDVVSISVRSPER